jgi:signal transduction histidine kinase
MESSQRIVYSRIIFATGIILLTALSIIFVYETYQENSAASIVYNSNIVRESLEKIHASLKARESALRGYAITRDSVYLDRQSAVNHHRELRAVDSLVQAMEDKNQTEHLKRLKALVARSVNDLEEIEAELKLSPYTTSNFHEKLRAGTADIDSLQSLIIKMQAIATAKSHSQKIDAQKHTIFATLVGVAASLFSMIVFVVAFYFIDLELKRSQNYVNKTESLNLKIAEINKELEEANRSLHQLNSELEGKNVQLEKYASELSTFTHITSHDMQEPLRKIEFFISVVEEREKQNLSEEGKKFLDKIRQSVSRMRQLFLSMLDFSLTNTVDNTIEDVDLNGVFEQTLNSLKVYIKDTNALIESDELPVVKGIEYQLIQLFENIVSNAIKFRQKDAMPEIQISCNMISFNGNALRGLKNDTTYYRIDFTDNGIGFDPKHAEKIFEIFHRLISRPESYGVGIGLAICRRIAENHGGIIMAESTPNMGSTFSFFIPVN